MNSVLIKLSGECLFGKGVSAADNANYQHIQSIVDQIKVLKQSCKIGIVIGGGNFFRASRQGVALGIRQPVADFVGMLATVMNGLLLQDFFARSGVVAEVLGAFEISGVVQNISNQRIEAAQVDGKIIIFVGGTGNPFFTTDTCAVLRALQIGAKLVWKATNVDGVYDFDPNKNLNAKILKRLSYSQFMAQDLKVMDLTSISLAQKYGVKIKVFNVFTKNALFNAANDVNFGSSIE
ncbi:MAG: Uridylate kinase [candidate division TM6 bacterium GW2011_GWF2_37_49]|nr:MAG: Uridylate kinase [candidate division TM6 bacterium GW2011_GWF2_37_49]